jgi:Family of unknown function (DUF5681)
MDAEKQAQSTEKAKADRIAPFRWQPGQSGNPNGRPPSPAVLSDALRAKLSEQYPGDRKHRTYAEKLAARLIESALRGSVSAIALIYERTEGKAPQSLTGPNGSPLLPTIVTRETLTATIHSLVSEIIGPDALEAALKSVQSQQTAVEGEAHGA